MGQQKSVLIDSGMQPQLKIYHGKHIIKCKIVLKIKVKEQTLINYQTTS